MMIPKQFKRETILELDLVMTLPAVMQYSIIAFWPDGSEPFRIARVRGYILPGVYNKADGAGFGLMLKRLSACY